MSFTTCLLRSQVCCVEELGLCVNSVLQYKQCSPVCLWTSFHLQWEQLLRVDPRLMVRRRDKERETGSRTQTSHSGGEEAPLGSGGGSGKQEEQGELKNTASSSLYPKKTLKTVVVQTLLTGRVWTPKVCIPSAICQLSFRNPGSQISAFSFVSQATPTGKAKCWQQMSSKCCMRALSSTRWTIMTTSLQVSPSHVTLRG